MGCPIKLPHHKFGGEGSPSFASLNSKIMAATLLHALVEQAISQDTSTLTFNIASVETKVSKTGKVGFRATTDQGTVITFWSSNMDQVVEPTDEEGNFRVVPGTSVSQEGSLIDKDAATSFWGK